MPQADFDGDLEALLAELTRKWQTAQHPGSTPADRSDYAAAAYWAAPRLIAEIRRLTSDSMGKEPDSPSGSRSHHGQHSHP